MIRHRLFALLLATLVLGGCSATNTSTIANLRTPYTRGPIATSTPAPRLDVDSLRTTHGRVPFVYLNYERTIEHQFALRAEVWDFVQDYRRQYVVLDPEDARASSFRIGADRRDVIEGVHLRVTSPDGSVRSFAMADLQQESDSDGLTYKLAYPGLQAGSVIDERVRFRRSWDRSFQPPLYHEIPLQFDVPADRLVFRYVYPSAWGLQLKQMARGVVHPFDLDRDSYQGRTVITAERTRVAAFPDEPFSPHFKEVGPYLEFSVTTIHDGDVLPVYEAPRTWEALGREMVRYVFSRRGGTTGPVARQAREIADEAAPDSVRLAAIVTWVQNEIEVVDEGGAEDLRGALDRRRANPYLITGLTHAMLEEAGLEASYVLIHPARDGYFDPAFIHARQFDDPAVVVRIGERDFVVFPYIRGLPVTYVPEFAQSATAMRLSPDGFAGFVQLPSGDGTSGTEDEEVDVTVETDGVLRVEERTAYRGASAYSLRLALEDLDAEEREDLARESVSYDESVIRDFSYTVEGEDDPSAPLRLTLRYSIDDLVTITPEEILVQTGGLLAPSSLRSVATERDARRNPIRIYHNQVRNRTLRVSYPETWTLTTPLSDVDDVTPFGRVRGSFTQESGRVTASQRIELRAMRAAPAAYPTLARLIGGSSRLAVPTLVFTP